MRIWLFLIKVSAIVNVFFLYCWWVQKSVWLGQAITQQSVVIILGWVMAPILNFVCLGWLLFLLKRHTFRQQRYLIAFNSIIALLQILKFLFHEL